MPAPKPAPMPRVIPNTAHTIKMLPVPLAHLLPAAHLAVLAAKGGFASPPPDPRAAAPSDGSAPPPDPSIGDPQSKALISTTLAHAEAGSPEAAGLAQVFSQAAAMQTRAQFVHYWLYGPGAKIAGR
jgi:hypothetical protein